MKEEEEEEEGEKRKRERRALVHLAASTDLWKLRNKLADLQMKKVERRKEKGD
jgi:hypothetical protein